MDQPQRANAAQMAARNIKVARGKNMRRTGPAQKDTPSKPSWAMPQNDAGLFGGSIQAAGTFDFAAPSNFKFNSISSGPAVPNHLPDGAENRNGRFAGDDRNLKRMFGQSAAPLDKSATQNTNVFSASQPVSGFAPEEMQNSSGAPNFNFQSGFNPVSFGQSTAAPAQPTKPIFSFGSTSQPAIAPNLAFGSKATGNLGGGIFNLDNQNYSQSMSNTPSQFGTPTSQSQSINPQLMFGQTSLSSQTTTSSIFGANTEKSSSSSIFGSQSINPTFDKNSLTVSSAEPAKINNIFEKSHNAQPQSSIFNTDSSNSELASNTNLLATKSSTTWGAPSSTTSNSFSAAFSMNGVQGNLKQSSSLGGALSGESQENTKSKNTGLKPTAQPTSLTNVFSKQPSSSNIFAHSKADSSTLPRVSSPLKNFSLSNSRDSEIPNTDTSGSIIDAKPQQTTSNQSFSAFSLGQKNFSSLIKNDNMFGFKNNHENDHGPLQAIHNQSHLSVNNTFNQAVPKDEVVYESGSVSSLTENQVENTSRTSHQNFTPTKENKESSNIFAQSLFKNSLNSDKLNLSNNIFSQAKLLPTDTNVSTNSSLSFPHLAAKPNDTSIAPFSASNLDKKLAVPTVQGEQPKALVEYRSAPQTKKRNKFAPEVLPENKSFRELALVSQIEEENIPSTLPSGSDEIDRQQFCATYRLRALNQAMAKMFADLPIYSDPQPALNFFTEERKIILEECSKFSSKTKRKFENEDGEDQSLSKKRRQTEIVDSEQILNNQAKDLLQSKRKRKLVEDTDQESQNSDKRNKSSQISSPRITSADSKEYIDAQEKNSQSPKFLEANHGEKKDLKEINSNGNKNESEPKCNINGIGIEKDVKEGKLVNKSIFEDFSSTPQTTRNNLNIFSHYNDSRKSTANKFDDKLSASLNPQGMSAISSSSVGNISGQEPLVDNDNELTNSESESSNNDKRSENKDLNIFKGHGKSVKNTDTKTLTGSNPFSLSTLTSDTRTVIGSNPFSSSTLNTDTNVSSETSTSPKSESEQSEIQIQNCNAKDDANSKPKSIFERVTLSSDSSSSFINSEMSSQQIAKNIFSENKRHNPSKEAIDLPSDQTWKPDTPIRFGATTVPGLSPSMNATIKSSNEIGGNTDKESALDETSANTSTQSSNSLLPKDKFATAQSTNNIITDNDRKSNSSKEEFNSRAPFPSLFGTSNAGKYALNNVGFRFGQSSGNSLFSSAEGTAEKSQTKGPEAEEIDTDSRQDVSQDDAEENDQINLTAIGPGEEDEDVIHEVRVKAQKLVSKEAEGIKKWEIKGIGPLRVLRHKNSGTSRLLLRGDPSGKIVLNKSILGNVTYKSSGKTIKFLSASDTGKEIETWILQVKTEEFADKLASVLEDQKPKA
ncbi:putative ran-binding protein [Golovinomyces cichoracearum]|uniref:Putative ran-binding protein n=1 Tax=Golovinomyces cichoracearum TaxID=62708 RepID=A0A420IDT7_9PEZI|nr:putative ran-binding protein [Golovinomyces cichoracearum]